MVTQNTYLQPFVIILVTIMLHSPLPLFALESPQDSQESKTLQKLNKQNREGESALLEAGRKGDTILVAELLQQGVDPFVVDKKGTNIIHYVALYGNEPLVSILIKKGVDVNSINNEGITPLMLASGKRALATVKTLLSHGGDSKLQSLTKESALHFAAAKGHYETAKTLLNHEADVNVKNKSGYSPLSLAVLNHHYKIARLFIDHGASISSEKLLEPNQPTLLKPYELYSRSKLYALLADKAFNEGQYTKATEQYNLAKEWYKHSFGRFTFLAKDAADREKRIKENSSEAVLLDLYPISVLYKYVADRNYSWKYDRASSTFYQKHAHLCHTKELVCSLKINCLDRYNEEATLKECIAAISEKKIAQQLQLHSDFTDTEAKLTRVQSLRVRDIIFSVTGGALLTFGIIRRAANGNNASTISRTVDMSAIILGTGLSLSFPINNRVKKNLIKKRDALQKSLEKE